MKKILLLLLLALAGWIASDLLIPRKKDLRDFDALEVGRLDADMWRSYYERRRLKLFGQLSRLMRSQFGAPFWRSFPMAYQAARAAAVFQDGRRREDYAKALPLLEAYFRQANALSSRPFDVKTVAKNELEWWIIRREPEHPTADWERILAEVAGEMYHIPAEKCAGYARLRVEAMVLRDGKGGQIGEEDWEKVTALLVESWRALYRAVNETERL